MIQNIQVVVLTCLRIKWKVEEFTYLLNCFIKIIIYCYYIIIELYDTHVIYFITSAVLSL